MTQTPKTVFLTVRVTDSTHALFRTKALKYGTSSDILRELVDAFIEGRLTITPPVNRKESLYVPRIED